MGAEVRVVIHSPIGGQRILKLVAGDSLEMTIPGQVNGEPLDMLVAKLEILSIKP